MIQPEELVGGEWAEWYRLTPVQRWLESEKLWQTSLALGGSLDPEPDTQSPFFDARASRPRPAYGRTGVRVLRRGRALKTAPNPIRRKSASGFRNSARRNCSWKSPNVTP
jgi:hypothetical protein